MQLRHVHVYDHMHLKRTLSKTLSDLVARFDDILDSLEQPTIEKFVKLKCVKF